MARLSEDEAATGYEEAAALAVLEDDEPDAGELEEVSDFDDEEVEVAEVSDFDDEAADSEDEAPFGFSPLVALERESLR